MLVTSALRCLITGGAGFLGSHRPDRLLDAGHEVVIFDNLITGREDNLAHRFGHPSFRFVKQDVTEFIYLPGALDAVVHFASPASPIDYLRIPIPTLKVGSLGTHKALGLSLAKRARFLLASTSEVYGDPQIHPQPESYWGHVNPVGPRGVYDEAKRFAEAMTMAYHRYHGLDTRIVRIFNSVLADETIVVCDDDGLHLGTAEAYAAELRSGRERRLGSVCVPAFDPATGRVALREAS